MLEYLNSVQAILNKQKQTFDEPMPTIAIQNNVILDDGQMSLDSREKIKDVIQSILRYQNQEPDNIVDGG